MTLRSLNLLAVAISLSAQSQDQVILNNSDGQQNGLIVWGDYGSNVFSKTFVGMSPVSIGDVGPCVLIQCKANEVVAFTAGMAPAYQKIIPAWELGQQTVTLSYPQLVPLRVKVWVLCADAVCGPLPPTASADIMTKLAGANLLFIDQSAGIQLSLSESGMISDQTGNTDKKTKYQDFGNQCDKVRDLVSGGMLDKDALNLYIVRSVENSFGRGQTCWKPNVAVFGYAFDSGLVAHEIGHNHWLDHAEFFPEMDSVGTKNIMHSLSNQRTYLSEGEVYRMHFERFSVLNRYSATYSNPPAQRSEARSCDASHALTPCPPLGTRLWNDPP